MKKRQPQSPVNSEIGNGSGESSKGKGKGKVVVVEDGKKEEKPKGVKGERERSASYLEVLEVLNRTTEAGLWEAYKYATEEVYGKGEGRKMLRVRVRKRMRTVRTVRKRKSRLSYREGVFLDMRQL